MATAKNLLLALLLLAVSIQTKASAEPAVTSHSIVDLNTPRDFPPTASRSEWQTRAKDIHDHILVSCGLWPMPKKTPLEPHIFGRIEHEYYTVEKVHIQTMPGFYLAGNLYRPLGQGKGPFPGILSPHGHWKEGRLVDTKDGSVAARCINFARQGMVAFSYDMVGFNDTHFASGPTNKASYDVHRTFGAAQTDQLWSISLMGLQTWNSIRALDFLESLPDVDKKRLACTGESGGGTQTFMLGAVDDRLAVQAPIVMVSHTMQGGCSCENAPGLRVDYSNMEIAAAPAPRPQLLVAATGDWTKDTMKVEGPSIAHIYDLLHARDKFDFVRFDFGHNYNQTSREAVYGWFGKWLLHNPDSSSVNEMPYQKEADDDLRVFHGNILPEGALTREEFTESLKRMHQEQWHLLVPKDKSGLRKFKEVMLPAWRHNLELEWPISSSEVQPTPLIVRGDYLSATIETAGPNHRFVGTYWAPKEFPAGRVQKIVVLAQPDGCSPAARNGDLPDGLPRTLLEQGIGSLQVNWSAGPEATNQFANFYTTYNRSRLQQRVRDLVTACIAAQSADSHMHSRPKIVLVGTGSAGIWALLAAPAADVVIADAGELDVSDDQSLNCLR